MINTIIFNNEIKVWWEYVKLYPNESFRLSLNGEVLGCTIKSHFNIKSLSANTEYSINVELIDENGQIKQVIGEALTTTSYDKKIIDVTKSPYNAIADGKTLNTVAIQKAIDDCSVNECVFFPDGVYLTGALDLKSNVELLLSDGAIIQGSTNEKDYLPKIKSRFEGCEELCYKSLFNAGKLDSKGETNCQNILIRGGKIFGGGEELRLNIINAERPRILKKYNLEREINPCFYYSTVLPGRARGRLIGFNNVKNVIIANCELGYSPSWNLHFTYCENVVTCSCKIISHRISNGDGWDPDSSKNCVLFDIIFDTGDDCVAIKSGKNLEGYLVARPCEHIRVFDVFAKDGHGIAIGSEMSGGIKDVAIWNCNISAGAGIYFKSAPERGGYIKDIRVYNCFAPTVSVFSGYNLNNGGNAAPVFPEISDLLFEDITVTGVGYFTGEHNRVEPETAFTISGIDKAHPVRRVVIKNLTLKYRQMIPNQYVCLNNVEGLKIKNIVCLGEI